MRFEKQPTDQFLGTSRFQNHGLSEIIKPVPENLKSLARSSCSQLGSTRNDDTGRFSSRMGIDEADSVSTFRDY